MIKKIQEILNNRNTGKVRISFIKSKPGDDIGRIASQAGLNQDPSIYHQIEYDEASKIILSFFSTDMAYGTTLNINKYLVESFMEEINSGKYYTNSSPDDSSWNSATDATFDKGVIVVNGVISIIIWAEDED